MFFATRRRHGIYCVALVFGAIGGLLLIAGGAYMMAKSAHERDNWGADLAEDGLQGIA